jgi:hypothetical protein
VLLFLPLKKEVFKLNRKTASGTGKIVSKWCKNGSGDNRMEEKENYGINF